MGIKVATVSAVGLLALLSACSEGNNSAAPTTTATSTPPGTTGSSSGFEPPSSGPTAGTCPVGEYEVTTITGKGGANVNGVPIVAKSGGGFKLALTGDSKWTLTGDKATVTLSASNVSVQATVDGTAGGTYAKAGTEYVFRQEKATGKVTLKTPIAGVSSFDMDQVGPALSPDGKATLTCGADSLKISSESVELDLKSTGGGGSPSTSTSEGGGGASGGTLTINDSGLTKTYDCGGRDVSINSSANKLTFTGSCGTVSVNGSRNQVKLAQASVISVNGSANEVTYSSGSPKVSNNGTGNKIGQG
jgi:hypothetical protein